MKYIFGPVPSRRLGRSLGVDPTPPPESLFSELRGALDSGLAEGVDWITFVGTGEPTRNKDQGALIRGVKAATKIQVAVITNGSKERGG